MLQYIAYKAIIYFNLFIVVYVIAVSTINAIQMVISMITTPAHLKKARSSDISMYNQSSNMVPISILVPAYNEELTIVDNIRSLLNLDHPTYEVVVISDGSTDGTLRAVIDTFQLKKITYPIRSRLETKEILGVYYNPDYPMLRLIDKENGGKADALNAGINLSRYPYFASIDADSLLESDALIRISTPFMEYKYTVAVGGIIRVGNGCTIKEGKAVSYGLPKKSIARFQIIEYFRAFLVGRVGWNFINSLLIISGAFGAFQKDAVFQVGGYTTGMIGEDMDLVLKLHKFMRQNKYKYRIAFLPDPVCWTQVPETGKVLYQQRRRWHIGLMDSLWNQREMFFNPRYGILGLVAMPYYFFVEMLGPVVEGLGLIMIPLAWFFGLLSSEFLILFFLSATVFGVILSLGALAIEYYTFNRYINLREVLLLSVYCIIENFFYRQMTVIFRLLGILGYRKHKNSWGKMKRQRFTPSEESPSAATA